MFDYKGSFCNRLLFGCVLVASVTLLSMKVWSSNSSGSAADRRAKNIPFIVLESFGDELNEAPQFREGPQGSLESTSGALVTSYNGYGAYQDGSSTIVTLDSLGKELARFSTYPVNSLAVRSNGNVIVASPVKKYILHEYSVEGELLRSYGGIGNYKAPVVDDSEMRFLRRGKILIDKADNVYYVFQHIPLFQKYSSDAKLLFEREVVGAAINLQQELAQRFFRTKPPGQVGGIDIINSATIDQETDHLWLCLNGSSVTAVVYEYSNEGVKIREYALQADRSGGQRVTGAKDVAVTRSSLYILSDQHQVLTFKISDASVRNPDAGDVKVQDAAPCGTAQTWNNCKFNCPGVTCSGSQPTTTSSNGSTLDCKTALQGTLTPGYVVISQACTTYPAGTAATPTTPAHLRGGCKNDVVICLDGMNSSHSITLDCPEPAAGSCAGGGGGTYPFGCYECDYQLEVDCAAYNGFYNNCCCYSDSPILIDTLGNGFALTDASGGVDFDFDGNGTAERLAWIAPGSDDAWLVLDRNGNGAIDNGQELFGNLTPQPSSPAKNGFLALAEYDKTSAGGNRDGMIDIRDSTFSSLRLWLDSNHNGISEPGELHTLPQLGVHSIALEYKESKKTDQYGNHFRYRAKVKDEHGAQGGRWAWDVFLVSW